MAALGTAGGCSPSLSHPILYADYSDPDVVRVGRTFYLVASTFHFSPGIPVLESHDLVHWSIVGHALSRLDFDPAYDLGPSGMTPRSHLQIEPRVAGVSGGPAADGQSDAPGFSRNADTYFPSNGSLLFAVALMAAGWDGESTPAPGFPHDGRWRVKSDGVLRAP